MIRAWDERRGQVSRAFSDWRVVDRDQRAFLAFGLRMARETYDQLWREAHHEPDEPPKAELVDIFDGLWPREFEWMLAAGVLRDAVTSFEVYVEQAWAELVGGCGRGPTAGWAELSAFFAALGVGIESEGVGEVRELRDALTYRRAQPAGVELGETDVIAAMDVLAERAREVDAAVWTAQADRSAQ